MNESSIRVFLSYGHDEHVELVRRIKNDLEARNFRVWMDESDLHASQDWALTIEIEIQNTHTVLAFMGPHSMRRPDGVCLDELAYARFKGKYIIPIMVKSVQPPLCISRIQWLDMQNWRDPTTGKLRESWYQNQLDLLLKIIKGEYHLCMEGEQASLLNALEPLDFGTEIEKHMMHFIGREWVFEKVHSWLSQKASSKIFWLMAEPGFGKTAIAAALAHRNPSIVGIHFCQLHDKLRSDPRRILCSLAYQLSTQLVEYRTYLLDQPDLNKLLGEKYDESLHSLFDILFLRPLRRINRDGMYVFIIDALDEIAEDRRADFLYLLEEEFSRLPDGFRLVVTSRPDPEISRLMGSLDPITLKPDDRDNLKDLAKFARHKLSAISDTVDTEYFNSLAERCGGNFLYMTHLITYLEKGRISLEDTEEFPRGLSGVYNRFFERTFKDKTQYSSLVRPILELLVGFHGVLPLQYVLSILEWNEYKLDEALSLLGSLFPVENGCLRPFHQSLLDWLVDETRSGRKFWVSERQGADLIRKKLWPLYANSKLEEVDALIIEHLPAQLITEQKWAELEQLILDPRIPMRTIYRHVNRFPDAWDFTRLKNRIFSLNEKLWDQARNGIPPYSQEIEEPFLVFLDIISERTASWFFELLALNFRKHRLAAFFRSGFSDTRCVLSFNPAKIRCYYAVKKVLETLSSFQIPIPEDIEQFYKDLRKSSLYMEGAYLLGELDSTVAANFSHVYRGDFLEGDPLFNTFALRIELRMGGADPNFVEKLLTLGAEKDFEINGMDPISYAEKQGDLDVAEIMRNFQK